MKTALGIRIKEHRKANKLTQEQLASKSGVPYTTLIKIESGAIKNPSVQAISSIASALGASLDDFTMVQSFREEHSLEKIWKDVITVMPQGGEMFISGVDEKVFLSRYPKKLKQFIKELKKNSPVNFFLAECRPHRVRHPKFIPY